MFSEEQGDTRWPGGDIEVRKEPAILQGTAAPDGTTAEADS